jgi:hypothetical protein
MINSGYCLGRFSTERDAVFLIINYRSLQLKLNAVYYIILLQSIYL